MPFSEPKQIDPIINIEIENYVPFDIDDMVISYQIIEKNEDGAKVLVALTKKSDLQTFLRYLSMAGLDPSVVTFGANVLANTVSIAPNVLNHETAILNIGEQQCDFAIYQDEKLLGVRSIPQGISPSDDPVNNGIPPILLRRFKQTLQSIRIDYSIDLEEIYVSGPVANKPNFLEFLGNQLEVESHAFKPFTGEFEKDILYEEPTDALFTRSLGTVVSVTPVAPKSQINFRKGEFAHKGGGGFFKAELKKIAIMGAILIVLFTYNMVYAYLQNRHEAEDVRQQVLNVFNETFPGQRVTDPVGQFKTNMEQVYKKYKIVGHLGNGDLHAVDALKHFSDTIPKTIKIDVRRFDVQQDRIAVEGATGSFEAVDKIEAALNNFKGFKEIKKDSATKTVNGQIKFKFSIRISDKPDATIPGLRSRLKGGM
jgi:type II secretory pathway component PulL